ncbi:unnamed protein product, partial [Meganyctiphanes norvegica]
MQISLIGNVEDVLQRTCTVLKLYTNVLVGESKHGRKRQHTGHADLQSGNSIARQSCKNTKSTGISATRCHPPKKKNKTVTQRDKSSVVNRNDHIEFGLKHAAHDTSLGNI